MAQASTTDPLPVGQLLRISDDREGLGLGVDRQSTDNHTLATARNWAIVETYKDNSKSAYRGHLDPKTRRWMSGRPDYDRCLADLSAGVIRGVVAYHPDRVFGHPRELEDLIDIVEATGAAIATCQTGSYDLSTPSGRLVARQLGAASRFEREMKAERQRRKHLELAQAGKIGGGGTRPTGYSCFGRHPEQCDVHGCPHDGTVSIIEHEAAFIREAARRIAAGEATRGVIADLTAKGYRAPNRLRTRDRTTGLLLDQPEVIPGKPWAPSSFTRMITSPRVAGLRQHQARGRKPTRMADGWSDVIGPATWPAIVERAVWEQVRARLFDPNRKPRSEPRRYLLAGLARCGVCEAAAKLVARPRDDKRRCYVCARGPGFNGCGKIRTLAEPLEELVVEAVLSAFDGPGLAEAIQRSNGQADEGAADELTEVDRLLDELEVDVADGIVDRRAYLVRRRRLTERREGLQRRLAARNRPAALSVLAGGEGPVRARWPSLSFDQRRAVLALALDRVTVGPAVRGLNRFDPRRVGLVWIT